MLLQEYGQSHSLPEARPKWVLRVTLLKPASRGPCTWHWITSIVNERQLTLMVRLLSPRGFAGSSAAPVWLGLMALTFFGTIFSIYLTALELFVIRAVCAWCLSSAVITTLLMLVVSQMVESRKPVTAV